MTRRGSHAEEQTSRFPDGGQEVEEESNLRFLHELGVPVEPSSRWFGRRQYVETDSWSSYSGDLGCRMVRPPTSEQLLASPDDSNSFRVMWSPLPPGELASNCRLSDVDYEPIRVTS